MADHDVNIRVARPGNSPQTVAMPAGEDWTIAKTLAEAGIEVNGDETVSLNGNVVQDPSATKVASATGQNNPVVLINPRVNNG